MTATTTGPQASTLAATPPLCLEDILGMSREGLAFHFAFDQQIENADLWLSELRLNKSVPDSSHSEAIGRLMYLSTMFGRHLSSIDKALEKIADGLPHETAQAASPIAKYVELQRTTAFEAAMLAVEAAYADVVVAADDNDAVDAATDRHTEAYMAMLDTPAWTARDVRRKLVEVLRQNGEVPNVSPDEAPMGYRAVIEDIHRLEARGC